MFDQHDKLPPPGPANPMPNFRDAMVPNFEDAVEMSNFQDRPLAPCALPQHRGQSGATSSELRPAYADAPRSFWRRLGLRFSLGAKLHRRGNWLRSFGVGGRPWDADYLRDRYNHAIDHLLAFKDEGSTPDDHLAAVAWFCAYAMQAEDLGLDWRDVLQVRTPEDEESRRKDKETARP